MWTVTKEAYEIDSSKLSDYGKQLVDEYFLYSKHGENGQNIYLLPHDIAVNLSYEDQEALQLPFRYSFNLNLTNTESVIREMGFKVCLQDVTGHETSEYLRKGSYIRFRDGKEYILSAPHYRVFEIVEHYDREIRTKQDKDEKIYQNYISIAEIQELSNDLSIGVSETIDSKPVISPGKMSINIAANEDETYSFRVDFENKDINEEINGSLHKRGWGDPGKRYAFDPEQREALKTIESFSKKFDKEKAERIIKQADAYFPFDTPSVDIEGIDGLSERVVGIGEFKGRFIPTDMMHTEWVPEGLSGVEKTGGLESRENNEKVLLIKDNLDDSDVFITETPHPRDKDDMTIDILKPDITLKSYQKKGVSYLQELWIKGYKGALLADDMGLGKTLQTLTFLSWRIKHDQYKEKHPILIVAPVSLLQNWKEECCKFIDTSCGIGEPLILHGNTLELFKLNTPPPSLLRKYGQLSDDELKDNAFLNTDRICKYSLIITNYETVRKYQLSLGVIKWNMLILDEAQNIKNPSSRVSHAVRGMNYNFGLALTGTPVENSWVDLWTIMDFCSSDRFGTLQAFNKEYIAPVSKAEGDISVLEKKGIELKEKIKPLLLRRMKQDVLSELPVKHEIVLPRYMSGYQETAYMDVVNQVGRVNKGAFEQLMQLRNVSIHPYLMFSKKKFLELPFEEHLKVSDKLQFLFEMLDDIKIKGEKALIFIRYKKLQELIRKLCKERYGVEILQPINGDMKGERRQATVNEFNRTCGFNVLILSPEAGGVGLNITSANHVIHLSREWNPAKEDQSTDRAYRIGQTKDVYVYYPIAKLKHFSYPSFDELQHELLTRKRKLSRSVIVPNSASETDGAALYNSIFSKDYTQSTSYFETNENRDMLEMYDIDNMAEILKAIYQKKGYTIDKGFRDERVDILYAQNNECHGIILVNEAKLSTVTVHARKFVSEIKKALNRKKNVSAVTLTLCGIGDISKKQIESLRISQYFDDILDVTDVRQALKENNMNRSDYISYLTTE